MLGDRGLIVRDLSEPAWKWAERLNSSSILGLIEAFASFDTVGLEIDPATFRVESLSSVGQLTSPVVAEKVHRIPVCYEMGEDLIEVGRTLGLPIDEVVSLHCASLYRCEAVGFCPGFPYLSGLDERLQGVPRRLSPRSYVLAGSVAITGSQAGIYPIVRPGGWALVGRTPLQLVDVEEGYFPIGAGDSIRFVAIGVEEFESLRGQRL